MATNNKFSVAALSDGTLWSDTQITAPTGQTGPAISTPTNFNNVPVLNDQSCAAPNQNVYFVPDSTTAPQAYFDTTLINPGAQVNLTLGFSQEFGSSQSFGLPNSFIEQVGTTSGGVLSPISNLAAFQSIVNKQPLILSEIWLQSTTQPLTQGKLQIVSFDYNISPSFRPVPLAFCDACVFNNNVYTQAYRGAFTLSPTTGISLTIPNMADGQSLRFQARIGGKTQFGYVDANANISM